MKWIRIWTEETVFGSTFDELNAQERGIWFSLLPMAALREPYGKIGICPGHGYTNDQLGAILKVEMEILLGALKKLSSAAVNKIRVTENNVIEIVNWKNYQTEYERQKVYRGFAKSGELQPKVTPEGYKAMSHVEGEVEGEEEKKKKIKEKDKARAKKLATPTGEHSDIKPISPRHQDETPEPPPPPEPPAPPEPPSPPEPPKPPRAPKEIPPAVKVFRETVHRFPNKSLYEEIDQAVGREQSALDFWRKLLRAWLLAGFNPMNLAGQLDAFKSREIPSPRAKHQRPVYGPSPAQEDRRLDRVKVLLREHAGKPRLAELVAGLAGVGISVVQAEIEKQGPQLSPTPKAKEGKAEAVGDITKRVMEGMAR